MEFSFILADFGLFIRLGRSFNCINHLGCYFIHNHLFCVYLPYFFVFVFSFINIFLYYIIKFHKITGKIKVLK